ncbi:MAG TPA: hypothetical protein VHE55_10715 [Fimbriimonadaceae bacterium]|nr:hypothetical protein [Fimbriimonadaceae bacterium]
MRKTRGEVVEGVAFQFCKVATVAFILGRWTLPVAAALASGLYVWAYFSGKRDTRCVLRYPLFIAAFWGIVSGFAFWFTIRPQALHDLMRSAGLPV